MMLDYYFEKTGPGAALGIIPDDDDPLVECYGFADIVAGYTIDKHTVFDLASIAKLFTATAVLLLYERGKLGLRDPLCDYIAGITHPHDFRQMTIQDLLWHTSGFPDYLDFFSQDELLSLSTEQVLEHARTWVKNVKPGLEHQYSNTNYVILSEVIKLVRGEPYSDFVKRELFDRYSINEMYVIGKKPENIVRARSYQNTKFGLYQYELSELDIQIPGDGGIYSSLSDLAHWLKLFFNGKILSEPTLKLALTKGRLENGDEIDYGCGVIVETLEDGRTWCGHNGQWYGVSTYFGRIIEDKVTIIVLSNDQSAPVQRIAHNAFVRWKNQS